MAIGLVFAVIPETLGSETKPHPFWLCAATRALITAESGYEKGAARRVSIGTVHCLFKTMMLLVYPLQVAKVSYHLASSALRISILYISMALFLSFGLIQEITTAPLAAFRDVVGGTNLSGIVLD